MLDEFLRGSGSERFERVRLVLELVLEQPAELRMAHLLAIAGSDPPLVDAVGKLLAELEPAESSGFLSVPDDCSAWGLLGSAALGEPFERIPEVIGAYRVVRPIGEGAMGIVYEALAPSPAERAVAIKVLRPGLSAIARARAVNEIRTQARLNHAGIAQLYDTGTMPDGRIWIATELVGGPTITEGLRDAGWDEKVRCMVRVAQAVQHAHHHGVVHRDLKPSNILLRLEGVDGVVPKIIDFGVATTAAGLGGVASERLPITVPGMLVGTLAYMSPEQLHGSDVDARTDVYGLGLILAELLAGGLPKDRLGGVASLLSSCERPVFVRVRSAGGRERDLEAIVAKATEPRAEQRYSTVQHLADDLERALAGRPAQACRSGALRRGVLFARRRPWSSALAIGAVLVIGGLLVTVSLSRARLAAEVADQRELIRTTLEESLAGLSEIQGTAQFRAGMVDSLLHKCEKQLRLVPSDREMLATKARLLRMRGDIEASLGDETAAMETLGASLALFARLRVERPDDVALGRQYAEGIVRLGDVGLILDRANNTRGTLERYHAALAVQRELLRHAPDDLGLQDDMTWSYDRIGSLWVLGFWVDDGEIEQWLAQRIDLSRRLLELDGDRLLSRYTLAMGHYRLADFARERGDMETAARSLEAGLPLIRGVVQAAPERTAFIRTYIHLLLERVEWLVARGDAQAAREAIHEVTNAARRHAEISPGDAVSNGLFLMTLRDAIRLAIAIGAPGLAVELVDQGKSITRVWALSDQTKWDDAISELEAIARDLLQQESRRTEID